MSRTPTHRHQREQHRSHRTAWLRAAILGANDGIVSVAALILGVTTASDSAGLAVTGTAGLVAGALSMAVGEYVSVGSQRDLERSERELESRELSTTPEAELRELRDIYIGRGLEPELADSVARQLTEHDALGAHLRDELGMIDGGEARPLLAAGASAGAFAIGGSIPLIVGAIVPTAARAGAIIVAALCALVVLGIVGADAAGSPRWVSVRRVLLGGGGAMALSIGIGSLVGSAV